MGTEGKGVQILIMPFSRAGVERGQSWILSDGVLRGQSFAVRFQATSPVLPGLPFAHFVHRAGLQHCGCDLPVAVHPARNFRFIHELRPADSFGHRSRQRFYV